MPTHQVENQSTPLVDVNLWEHDAALQSALQALAPAQASSAHHRLNALGARCGSAQAQAWAFEANQFKPQLHTHDRFGHRLDEARFHPAYHHLMALALGEGLHAQPWAHPGPGAQVERAAAYYLFGQLENGVQCPVTMTYAVIPVMAQQPGLAPTWLPRLLARDYDPILRPVTQKTAVTMGMGMTEKQGGSDVRRNSTLATLDGQDIWGERYTVRGHKWFFSAPMCDAFLILAQTDPDSSAGLTCFFLPRILPDGQRNHLRVQRLKDKIGNLSNASSEVEFEDAYVWRVGEVGRGVPTILEMGNHTRLDCAIGSAAIQRAGLIQSLHHARARQAFGRHLAEQPLMQSVLADLCLESEASMWLALFLARTFDADADATQQALRRVLTPAAKYWICKRLPHVMAESMEVLGGNGYVEEGPFGRLFRESPLNSIWEGSGNVMCLDVLRALGRGHESAEALRALWQDARGLHPAYDAQVRATEAWLFDPARSLEEHTARAWTERIALLTQAALLWRHAPQENAALFVETRLGTDWRGTMGSHPALAAQARAIMQRAWPQA